MGRKAKVKLKRGKIKIKLKSADDLLLLPAHDGLRALLGSIVASESAALEPDSASKTLPPAPRRALPAAPGAVPDAD